MNSWIKVLLLVFFLDSNAHAVSQESIIDTSEKGKEDGCYLLGRGPGPDVNGNPGLNLFVSGLTQDLKREKWTNLYKYFHKRAKVRKDIGDRVEAILGHRYRKPREFSVYGIWSMISQEGKRDLYECPKADRMELISHSGYRSQYMVVYQLMSQNELGRLFFSIAGNSKNILRIVGFHIQQWSHQGVDWLAWTEKGNKFLKNENHRSAYIHFDIAQKLLDGGTLVHYPYRKEIIIARDQVFTQAELVKELQKDLDNKNIVYVGTVLSRTDTGLIVKVEIEKEYNSEDLRKKCVEIGHRLVKSQWLKDVNGGVNCSFIPKGTDPMAKSKIGGYYITRDQIQDGSKK